MPPTGLSLLTHSLIVLLGLGKRLVEFIAQKTGHDVFKCKMNLHLGSKMAVPLTGQAGDSRLRRVFAYLIVLGVFVSVSLILVVSVGSRLRTNSNIDFVAELLKNKTVAAEQIKDQPPFIEVDLAGSEQVQETAVENFQEKQCYLLPISQDDLLTLNNNSLNLPAFR
jgi:hypothetical protein